MSTITKERIANLLQFNSEGSDCQANAEQWEVHELARIALASLEAEPVYQFIYNNPYEEGYTEWLDCNKDYFNGVPEDCRRILYTAPPAPVSVPDEATPENIEILASTYAPRGVTYQWDRDECNAAADSWNGCRAAMLQGAENVEPLHAVKASPLLNSSAKGVELQHADFQVKADGNSSDGWVACSERMPENDDFVYIWPRPDFGVELHVAQYGKFDKRDAGWYVQVYEQNYGIEYHPITVTHWTPLPAAPQQEAK